MVDVADDADDLERFVRAVRPLNHRFPNRVGGAAEKLPRQRLVQDRHLRAVALSASLNGRPAMSGMLIA